MKPENWIKWDLDSRNGVAMSIFFAKHGCAGYGFFVVMVEMLYRAKGHRLPRDDDSMQNYATLCKCNALAYAKEILADLTSLGLFKIDETHFWSPRVFEELGKKEARIAEISEARRKAAERRWAKSLPVDANAMQTDANAMQTDANAMQNMQEKRREEERRGEKSIYNTINSPNGSEVKKDPEPEPQKRGGSLKLSELNWPPCLNNQQCKEALTAWLAHKKQRRESYKNADSVNRLLKHWGKTSAAIFLDVVDTAIRNNWAGLHPPDPRRKPDGSRKSNDDLNRELHERIAAEEAAALQAEADAAQAYGAEQAAMEAEHGN